MRVLTVVLVGDTRVIPGARVRRPPERFVDDSTYVPPGMQADTGLEEATDRVVFGALTQHQRELFDITAYETGYGHAYNYFRSGMWTPKWGMLRFPGVELKKGKRVTTFEGDRVILPGRRLYMKNWNESTCVTAYVHC